MSQRREFLLHIGTLLMVVGARTPPVPNRNRVPSLFSNAELLHCMRWVWPATPSPDVFSVEAVLLPVVQHVKAICFGRNPFRTLVLLLMDKLKKSQPVEIEKKHQSWPWILNLNYYPNRRRVLSISMKCLKQLETMKNFGGWQVRSHHILQKWLKQWWQIWENPGLVPLAFCGWAFFKPLASRRNSMLTTNQGNPPAVPSVPSISISIQPGSIQASSLVLQFNQQGQCMLPLTSFLAGTHCCIEGHHIAPQSYCLPKGN